MLAVIRLSGSVWFASAAVGPVWSVSFCRGRIKVRGINKAVRLRCVPMWDFGSRKVTKDDPEKS